MSEIPAYHPENESKVSQQEIIKFRQRIIWPVAHRVWGHTFPKRMAPGESLETTKVILSPNRVRLVLGLYCFEPENEDAKAGKIAKSFLVRVGSEESQPLDFKQQVIHIAKQKHFNSPGHELNDKLINDLDAWENRMFAFEFPSSELIDTHLSYSLQNDEGYTVWDDSELGEDDEDEPEITWHEVEELYGTTEIAQITTHDDIDHILGVLSELGAPKRMLRWPRKR